MKIGCHISVGKGLLPAVKKANEMGAEALQVFTKNPRGLKPKRVDEEDAAKAVSFLREKKMVLVTHTPYITNLSTPKEDLWEVTVRSLREDLHISQAYGAIGAVVHCGKHVGEGTKYGISRMIETINHILDGYDGPVKLLLENTAGQGTELGTELEALMEIRNGIEQPKKLGFCFDTCHAFAAGEWKNETFSSYVERMKSTGYLEQLVAIHFNDSKVPFNSRKDRHEKIGKGEIGEEGLKKYLTHQAFAHLPIILETPVDDEQEYQAEMEYLRELKDSTLYI
jgi:deoxyribonuclease-4